MNRFDYVKYDDNATKLQSDFKDQFMVLESMVDKALMNGRAKSLVYTKLEECYMWVGKAIRDEQCEKRGDETLQESRGNE